MSNELIIAIFAGLGAMMGWGFADFFAKKTIDKIGDIATLFWQQLIGIIPLALLFLLKPIILDFNSGDVLFIILLGVWSGLSYLPAYNAFGKGKISLLSPIFASYSAVVVILSALVFKEIIPFQREVALLIVFIGLILVNGDPRDLILIFSKKKVKKIQGLPQILLAMGLYSVWLLGFDQFLNGRYWVPYLLGIRIFSTIALFLFAKTTRRSLEIKDKSLLKFLIPIGLFDVAAFSFVAFGYSATSFLSIVTMLSAAFSLPTIILARIFLKEKVNRVQTIGSLIILVGIIIISLV